MLSVDKGSNQVGEVPPTVLVNSFIFNPDFRKEVCQTLKSFGRDAVLEWLTDEVKIDNTEAQVLVKSIMKKEGW